MNRIILIGNGFDLAHGLASSYKDFINDYWTNVINDIKKLDLNARFDNDEIEINWVPNIWIEGISPFDTLTKSIDFPNRTISFKNKFLKIISEKHFSQNWVDIENEYYFHLKNSLLGKDNLINISKLNYDFERLKLLLENYLRKTENSLKTKVYSFYGKISLNIFYDFKIRDFSEESINKLTEIEFDKIKIDLDNLKYNKKNIVPIEVINTNSRNIFKYLGEDADYNGFRKLLISNNAQDYFNLKPEQILFLSFNYTNTDSYYYKDSLEKEGILSKNIHIHGSLNKSDKNPIIFGFGDEIDENYRSIENLNDNRYLENIKSIRYLETDNYKRLLEFVNGEEYQIFIFGHSCGISDRTLLNTLFEHKNCVSIKPYYYKISETEDNYSEIVRNISRNFNNKALMRDKVVNKEYCEPLS